jgi:glucose/galactose transporter
MGICNKTAGMIAPIIMGAIVLKNATSLETQLHAITTPAEKETILSGLAGRVIMPYLIMSVVLVLLAAMIKASSLPEINLGDDASLEGNQKKSVFEIPHLLLGVVCLFLYVGVEVLAGDGISTFARTSGLSLDSARFMTSFTMGAMLVGYVIGIITIPKYLSQSMALRICAISGLVFGICILLTTGKVAITFIALLGLSNSLMWPAIWPLVLEGLGKFTKIGSALLIMGIVGGSIIPPIYPALKDKLHIGNNLAFFLCVAPCYAFILYYAVKGHLAGREKAAAVAVA